MSGAYAEALEQKLHGLLDYWEQRANDAGLTFGPRIVGSHCPLPWHCEWPMRYWKGCSVCRVCGDGGIFEAEVVEGGPCRSCEPGSVSIEWLCPQCGGTGLDPDEPDLEALARDGKAVEVEQR